MVKDGKIDLDFFKQNIAEKCGFKRPEILAGPKFGVDVSVVEIDEEKVLISASDPMSFIPGLGAADSAWLSVVLTSNDMATSGYAPQFAQMVLNLSGSMSSDDFTNYWEHIHQYCEQLKISIIGGHTGFVSGQNSTFSGGVTMFSIGGKNRFLTSDKASENDVIIMTKQAAMMSTSILAKSFPETVKKEFGEEVWEKASAKFRKTSVIPEALIAAERNGVTAMHDVTEGGIFGAVYEMMLASEKGFEINDSEVSIDAETEKMSELFGYNPYQSVGAGSLIITVNPDFAEELLNHLKSEKIDCAAVGTVKPKDFGFKIMTGNSSKNYIHPEKDSYWAAFYNALQNGWT